MLEENKTSKLTKIKNFVAILMNKSATLGSAYFCVTLLDIANIFLPYPCAEPKNFIETYKNDSRHFIFVSHKEASLILIGASHVCVPRYFLRFDLQLACPPPLSV